MMGSLARILLALSITLALTAGLARAQPAFEPERCQQALSIPLPTLEARRDALRRTVAPADSPARSKKEQQEQRDKQEQLLQVLFEIDCWKSAPETVGTASRQRRAREFTQRPVGALEVTTYYATNRKVTGNTSPASLYGAVFDANLQYGRAIVSIPPGHTPGNLELPTLWKLEREADPNKHFVLKAVQPLDADAARNEIADKLRSTGTSAVLLFVHGYNTSFADAALRTAQLAHDLSFPGLAMFYSWPSAGRALAYWQDEETSQLSEVVFDQLLTDLSRLPVADIYIVAHSMGNRIVSAALRNRVEQNKPTAHIRGLLLAAPDINAELFRTSIAPKIAALQGTQTTIYAASEDLALRASKIVHGFKRVGETDGGVFVYPGFDTIDASSAANVIRSFGHSYLMDSSPVLADIKSIILKKLAANQRGLSEVGTSPNFYWQLR
jgi:esterase/lipase superfamily enzyme